MRPFHALCATVFLLGVIESYGKYALVETTDVPIDRLLANLERRMAQGSNGIEMHYDLARLYSMPDATNVAVATNNGRPFFGYGSRLPPRPEPLAASRSATTQHQNRGQLRLAKAIFHYQQAASLLSKQTNAIAPNQWLVLPVHLGLSWCFDEAGRTNDAMKAYRETLELAWNEEVAEQIPLKERGAWTWSQIRAGKGPLAMPGHVQIADPGPCYSAETIGYLFKLLDPDRDEKEISRLKEVQQLLQQMPRARWITPILVSLSTDSDLAELTNPNARVPFDLDGSGLPRKWGWITPKAAWLVYDPSGGGRITSGLQMFGNVTFWIFWRDGYAALSALDDHGDGVLRGSELQGLALWRDLNGNGICDPGEVRPVSDWGITAIRCHCVVNEAGILCNPAGVELRDGSTRASVDWIAASSER